MSHVDSFVTGFAAWLGDVDVDRSHRPTASLDELGITDRVDGQLAGGRPPLNPTVGAAPRSNSDRAQAAAGAGPSLPDSRKIQGA
jgi:hypothetical protein